MNWRDFLALAIQLASGSTEAEYRTAVSRAYYVAFHVARRLFADLGFTVPRAERAHPYLILRLSNCGEPLVEQAGRELDTLRRLRNRADYDDLPSANQAQALTAVRAAEGILQALDAAQTEPTRTNIRDRMIVYERDVLRDVTWRP